MFMNILKNQTDREHYIYINYLYLLSISISNIYINYLYLISISIIYIYYLYLLSIYTSLSIMTKEVAYIMAYAMACTFNDHHCL